MTTDPEVHPDALLAEYVEGSLHAAERARVEAHVGACARCREEVGLAGGARSALAELPELAPPSGLGMAVRRRARQAPRASGARRYVAPVAAAAILIAAGIAVVASRPDGGGETSPAAAPEEAGGETTPQEQALEAGADQRGSALPRFRESPAEYTEAGLAVLARSLRDEARTALNQGLAPSATDFYAEFDPSTLPPDLRRIYRCVITEVPPDDPVVPFTIVGATFEGEPVYVASFLRGPAPDQGFDRLMIWIVGREDCRLRSLVGQRL